MPDVVTPALAKDWIPKLWKQWSTIRTTRKAELQEITNELGDPELLKELYVEPDCQMTNPADVHEEEAYRTFRQPIRQWINGFLEREFFERDGRNTLFVLSDAGMGKTSLLMMLKLTHLMRFWPSGLDFKLMRLGSETLKSVEEVTAKNKTVLLLDALDEDDAAWGRIDERLADLLHATKSFRQVIVTCRTQFFPKGGKGPIKERPEKIEVAGFVCNLIYLSPFNDSQVETYLRKVYPNSLFDRLRKCLTKQDNKDLVKARQLVLRMESLKMRPMLLAYIQDLMEIKVENLREFSIYEALVGHWLLREKRKKTRGPTEEELWQACRIVATHLQLLGRRELSMEELRKLLILQPVAEHIREMEVGGRSLLNRTSAGSFRFAHYSIQEFLVVHDLISGSRPESPLWATDQIVKFAKSWIAETPHKRLLEFPWSKLDIREEITWEIYGVVMVLVPGGTFTLGAKDIDNDSKPIHEVNLSSFRISKYPITNEQYSRYLEKLLQISGKDYARPEPTSWKELGEQYSRHLEKLLQISGKDYAYPEPASWKDIKFNHPKQPVAGVSWHEALTFCRWSGFDLPSEAQWEAAARGKDARRYPWGNERPTDKLVNFRGYVGRTTKVGHYPEGAGPYGTLDQAGNVWEWCWDIWDSRAYQDRDGRQDPILKGDMDDESASRVVRGGSWSRQARQLRAAFRFSYRARSRLNHIGFRVVLNLPPDPASES